MGVFHLPGPVFWFWVLFEEEEDAEKLRCSWLDVDDSREEDTCGCGAQWSGPTRPADTKKHMVTCLTRDTNCTVVSKPLNLHEKLVSVPLNLLSLKMNFITNVGTIL